MSDFAGQLERLEALYQRGALSASEFEQAKAALLRIMDQPRSESPHVHGISLEPGHSLSKLRRLKRDHWLGGICTGLAMATATESWLWRIIFIFITLFGGFGVVIYIAMWLLVPEKDATNV
ncbi:MAG: PspC domain-containing protein [Burkholderiaceae bacterium]